MIQSYTYKKWSIASRIPKENFYRISPEERGIWYKILEATKATIMGNAQTTHNLFSNFNFYDVTLGGIIRASSNQFDFGGINNDYYNVYYTVKDASTNVDGNFP